MATSVTVPQEFTLLNREWKVKWLTDGDEARIIHDLDAGDAPMEDGEIRLWGYCDVEHAVIYIKPSKSKDHMMHTFLHELGHSIFYALGWELPDEESKVDALGAAFHQFLKSKKGKLV